MVIDDSGNGSILFQSLDPADRSIYTYAQDESRVFVPVTQIGNPFASMMRGYIDGYQMSCNTLVSNNTIFFVDGGSATDSTNTLFIISNTIFQKDVSLPWSPGATGGAMGNGVSFVANTPLLAYVVAGANLTSIYATNISTYHVHSILLANGATDIYVDSDPLAGHAPPETVKFRRVGSLLANSSSHVIAFWQSQDEFLFHVPLFLIDVAGFSSANVYNGFIQLPVPQGVTTNAKLQGTSFVVSGNTGQIMSTYFTYSQLDVGNLTFENDLMDTLNIVPGGDAAFTKYVRADLLGYIQFAVYSTAANGGFILNLEGYVDPRGKNNF